MNDDRGPLRFIADLIEAPSPRDTLEAIKRDLTEISQMADKARTLFRSGGLNQPDAHAVYLVLMERLGYKEYAHATIRSLLDQPTLPANIAAEANALKERASALDNDLTTTLLHCYLALSKKHPDIKPAALRKTITLAELSNLLQKASLDLSNLLHSVVACEKLEPLPITHADIEKGRTELRHNRAEAAIAATLLPPRSPTDPDKNVSYLAAQAALYSIADILDALETAYRDMEKRLSKDSVTAATVH